MGCVAWTALLTTAGWIVGGALLLTAVAVIGDHLTGRPRWTPDSYRRDGAPPPERIT